MLLLLICAEHLMMKMWKSLRCPVSPLLWSLLVRLAFNSRSLKTVGKVWRKEEWPLGKKDQIRGHSNRYISQDRTYRYECIPDSCYPLVLRELASHHKATAGCIWKVTGHSCLERFLRTGRKQILLLYQRERRRIQGTAGFPASL